MDKKAAEHLAEPIHAEALVATRGTGKRMASAGIAHSVAGVAGAMAAEAVATRRTSALPEDYRGYVYVALTGTRLAFFESKQGLLGRKAGNFLGELGRGEVASIEFTSSGLTTSNLDITTSSGDVYELEVPRAQKGKIDKLRAALGA
jgi:hypothetical protein